MPDKTQYPNDHVPSLAVTEAMYSITAGRNRGQALREKLLQNQVSCL